MTDEQIRDVLAELSQLVFAQGIEIQAVRELLSERWVVPTLNVEERITAIRAKLRADANLEIRAAEMEKLLDERRKQ